MSSDLSRKNKPGLIVKNKAGVPVYEGELSFDSITDLIDRVREQRIREIAAAALGDEELEWNSIFPDGIEKLGDLSKEQIPRG